MTILMPRILETKTSIGFSASNTHRNYYSKNEMKKKSQYLWAK
jgi:hypothetical protein